MLCEVWGLNHTLKCILRVLDYMCRAWGGCPLFKHFKEHQSCSLLSGAKSCTKVHIKGEALCGEPRKVVLYSDIIIKSTFKSGG